jgi:hypothetical protein
LALIALPALVVVASCREAARSGDDARTDAESARASLASPEAGRGAGVRPWPSGAPPSDACQTHEDCSVVVWDGPQPPDPCCDQRVGYMAMSRAFLTFMADFRTRSCGGAVCPPSPLPGAEPACCASIPRCVARKCVTACNDGSSDTPKVSVLDSECRAYRSKPVEALPCERDASATPKEYAGGASSPGFARVSACCASLRRNAPTLEYGAPFEMTAWAATCDGAVAQIAAGCRTTKLTDLRQQLRGKGIPDCQLP